MKEKMSNILEVRAHPHSKITILILDSQPLMSEMITMLIHRIHAQTRIVTASTFKRLSALIDIYDDVNFIIMEPQSIGCLGHISIAHIAKRLPDTQLIIITDSDLDDNNNHYLQNGAHYFIAKKDSVKNITANLQKILNCQLLNSETSLTEVGIRKITKRHRQLINLLGQGYTNRQIAEQLDIREHTVKVHFHRLYKALGVNNRLQALHFAKVNGWLIDNSVA